MHIILVMPDSGEDGVIIATLIHEGITRVVEFRGTPYSLWDIGDDTPMIRLHSSLKRVNISEFQNGVPQTVTSWHPEWLDVLTMVKEGMEC